MKKRFYLFWMWLGLACGIPMLAQTAEAVSGAGVVRVKLQPEIAAKLSQTVLPQSEGSAVRTGITPLDRVGRKVQAVSLKRVFPYSPKFEERHKKYGLDRWYEISYSDASITPAAAKALYKGVPGVEIAEEVRPVELIGSGPIRMLDVTELAAANRAAAQRATEALPFNDPFLSKQWHYHNDGSLVGSVKGADINLFKAWEEATGSSDVLVAIIDGGVQTNHPDLKDNMYVNEAELNGVAGQDDDGNGYVDDVYGWNFVINSADISAHDHGTHVAGTVGAVNNNGIGVAGVAGGNGQGGVKMLSCQIFDNRSSLSADWAGALVYAADMGASIAQCSWGWSSAGYYEQAVLDAIDYFTAEGGGDKMHGGLCIFAGGNNGELGDFYPAAYPKTLAVAAMDCGLNPATYSNYGEWVDVTAPGGLMDFGSQFGVMSTTPNDTYGYMEGTSMATPHVSGIAALVLSKYGNPDFSNETLRQQLVSSVNDLYANAPAAKGLFGSGYIDAYKSLQVGTGAAPEAVSDFTVTPSQDNALIEWIIPDAEEKSVDHHIIYYSTTPFSEDSDLKGVSSVSVDTKFYLSGDKMQYELGGLTPLTTYYFAIKSVSRLGVSAALSPVKEATTNAGPEVTLSKTQIDLATNNGEITSDELVINNVGEGILKYTLSAATKSASVTNYGRGAKPGRIVPFNGAVTFENVSEYPVVSSEYEKEDYPQTLTYARVTGAYVGESDLTLPNAQAQYFYVDPEVYPDGFNLTALNIGGAYGSDPVIEIYDGATSISKASLLQTYTGSFYYNFDLNLSEQIFFKPGSAFWVVAKFPAGQTNPLGAALVKHGYDVKQYSFYSCDNGESWTQLSEVMKEGNLATMADSLTWNIKAIMKNPDWSSVLSPSKLEGTVRPGSSDAITLKNDGQPMVNGTYKFNLNVNTNETAKPKQQVGVTLKVTGYQPQLTTAKVVDFGDLLVGQEKKVSVEITNTGYGPFAGNYGSLGSKNISSTSTDFVVPTYMSGIAARSTTTMDVTFRPTKSGSLSGTVKLTDKNGNEHSFIVRGVASMPAELQLDKEAVDFGTLEVGGEEKVATVKITNSGEYPLQYVFPKYSDETIEGATGHKFGYSYISNLNGSTDFAYDGNPALINEKDITAQFTSNNWQSEPIDLGFKFPFFGEDYTQVYVTSHGSVSMKKIDGNIACLVPTGNCVDGLGYISAYGNSGKLTFGANSKVTYGRQDGKFTVKFKDVLTPALNGGDEYTPVSFHFSLAADGSVECFYDDYDPSSVFYEGTAMFVGVSDIDCQDPFVVTDADAYHEDENNLICKQIQTGSAIKIEAPKRSMVKSLSKTSGVVNIGESEDIVVTAAATEEHYAGKLTNQLTLLTNDPKKPSTNIVLSAVIAGDQLKPVAAIDSTSVDFGRVFRTSDQKRSFLLSNNGTDSLHVTTIAAEGGKLVVADNVANGFVVAPGLGKDVYVTLPTETEGAVSDEIVVTYADGTTATIPVKGTVVGVPTVVVSPNSIAVTTDYKVDVEKEITVTNGGNETLTFKTEPNEFVSLLDYVADEQSKVDYVYKASGESDDVEYSWVDLTTDKEATHQDIFYYIDNTDFYTVDLPFEFPFYGKKYKKMYIYNTGFVSFSEHTDYKQFPEPPAQLPDQQTFYSNIIAPFWGNHTMGEGDADGSYYKVEDDHVVVSYVNYGNSAMVGMNFQLLLYKDGHYKFQYKLDDSGMMLGVYGLAGIQDETGTRGIDLAEQYIASGNAIEFYPVMSYDVAPDATKTLPINVSARKMAGDYATDFKLQTNVPGNETVSVPVTISIDGKPEPVMPSAIEKESVASEDWPMIEIPFSVSNKGSKAFRITNLEFNPENVNNVYLQVYTSYEDWMFGEIITGWTYWQPGMTIEVGTEPVQFKLAVQDTGEPTTYDLPMTFTLSGIEDGEETVVVPFKYALTEAPKLAFDRPALSYNHVAADFQTTETINIKNEGAYKMTYSLRMDPTGKGESEQTEGDDGGGIAPAFAPERRLAQMVEGDTTVQAMKVFEGYAYDVPPMDCNNILYYPVKEGTNNALMIGTGESNLDQQFRAATQFKAPAEGFNLTHLYFASTIGDLENVDIEASVIGSSDVNSDNVIGHGTLHVEKENPVDGNYIGEPRTLTFDRPVYINPEDTFYVVLKFPAGYRSSALLALKDDKRVRANRYMAWIEGEDWFDLAEAMQQSYGGSYGYFMTCVEEKAGEPWVKLLDTPAEGELAVGESVPVKIQVKASAAYHDTDNRAVLVVKSTDPNQPIVNYPITLSKNVAPQLTLPSGVIAVAEAESAQFDIIASDSEGDAFTVKTTDESGLAKLDSCKLIPAEGEATMATPAADGSIAVPAGSSAKLSFSVKPTYGQEGSYKMSVSATDEGGGVASGTVSYNVAHSNQLPVFNGPKEYTIAVGESSPMIDFASLFTDPDGDEMDYTVKVNTDQFVSLFTSETGFVFYGKQVGTTVATLTATDGSEGRTLKRINLKVTKAQSIGEAQANTAMQVAPNPVESTTKVTLRDAATNVAYRLYDATGRLVFNASAAALAAGEGYTLNLSALTPGIYQLEVTTAEGRQQTMKLMKK